MKPGGKHFWLLLAAILFAVVVRDAAQSLPPLGHATDFSSDFYFDAPNDMKIQTRLSGAEALPLPGGLLNVKQFKVEMFDTNGTMQAAAQAPDCIFALLEKEAHSPGHLKIVSGDGRFQVEGDGFFIKWPTNAMSLTLSNNVRTEFEHELLTPLNP
jgi:hypothetical protein